MSEFLAKCYWVAEDFLAGATFDGWTEAEAIHNLEELSRAGIKVIVSLAGWTEFILDLSRREWFQEELERRFTHYVFPLVEGQVPTRPLVRDILDAIDIELSRQRRVCVHCCSGRGRTGTIVGCWLARHGCGSGEEVLEAITALRRAALLDRPSPENELQRSLVKSWNWQE